MTSDNATRRVAGFPTHVVRLGRGQRRVLFIHCTLGHAGSWTRVQAALLDKLSMTAFDRPGHGRSGPWDTGADPGALRDDPALQDGRALHDLTTSIAARLIDRRADIVGHSFGATVALRLAIERPELVRRLVLIEPPMLALLRGTPAYAAQTETMTAIRAHLAAGERAAAARAFHASVSPEVPWEGLAETVRSRMAEQIHLVVAEQGVTMDDSPGLLDPGRLEAVKNPVLLVEGSRSPPALRAIHEALSGRMPQAQRVIVAGAGHMSPLTHPENVAGEIAAFLKV